MNPVATPGEYFAAQSGHAQMLSCDNSGACAAGQWGTAAACPIQPSPCVMPQTSLAKIGLVLFFGAVAKEDMACFTNTLAVAKYFMGDHQGNF